jgi:Beta-propeller repeat
VSNPSASRKFLPAGWIVPGSIVAVAVLAAIGIAGSAGFREHSGSAPAPVVTAASVQSPVLSAEQRGRVRESLGTLPLAFEANQGQTDPQVKYMARGNGYTVFLTANDTVFALQSSSQAATARTTGKHAFGEAKTTPAPREKDVAAAIRMHLVGGNAQPQIVAGSQLPGVTNYYIGSDPSKWQAGVKQFAGVSYRDIYPGVNMAFHGEQRQLEFDFIVAAGASAEPIRLGFSGARRITTDASGNLLLSSAAGDVVMHKPAAYQEIDGQRQNVTAEFVQESNNRVAFALGTYDRSRELVIDPSLSYATYLGGSNEDEAFAIALDGSGNAYVTGQTKSPSFGGKAAGPTFNVFVTKVNSTGKAPLVYTDILAATGGGTNCSASGTGSCSGLAIAVDGSGNAYAAGSATAGFPTLSAFQTTFGGGATDAFVLKLNSSGTLVYSTYLGGSGDDNANAIAVDGSGSAYVAGETHSANFPLQSAFQSSHSGDDAFVTKVASAGSSLVYSTYLGGYSGNLATGIALDSSKNAYVAGITVSSDFPTTTGVVQTSFGGGSEDGFVTEVKADGSAWVYSTYLGGSGADDALGVAVDAAGEAYVTGDTNSSNFPTVNAAQKALGGNSATNVFVTKLNAGATALLFSTYYGGTLDDAGTGIALDSFGDAYVTGRTMSSDYPVSNAFQQTLSGTSDAFVTEFSNTGFVEYSSFLGGAGTENDSQSGSDAQGPTGAIAVDSTSNAYLAGATASTTDFPTTAGVVQANYGGGLADGFVAKVGAAPADFSVAVSPTSTSTTAGQTTGPITVTVSSVNSSYGQAVGLSCGSLPTGAACDFTSTSVTPTGSVATSTLTITTTGAAAALYRTSRIFYAMWLPIVGLSLIGMRFSSTESRRKRLLGFLLLGLVMAMVFFLPACGGSSGGGHGGCSGCTPAGTYNITVSGQGGGATHSAPLTLTVN